jgi:hypothetical protein
MPAYRAGFYSSVFFNLGYLRASISEDVEYKAALLFILKPLIISHIIKTLSNSHYRDEYVSL